MGLFRKFVYCLVAVVPVAALASCAGGQAATVPSGQQQSITVEAVPTADEAGLYIAADQGLFRQQGLNVKIKPTSGGEDTLPDLNSGKAQIVAGNYVSFVQFQAAHQANLRIVAGGSLMQNGNQAVYVMPGSPYHTVADLAADHAVIGVNTPNNVGQLLISALMASQGRSLRDVSLKAAGGFPQEIGMLQSHKLAAAWLPEPFGTEAQQNFGAVPLADLNQGPLANFPIGCYVGTAQWVQGHQSTVTAFLRALQQGQQIANNNRPAVQNAMEKYLHVKSIVADAMTFDSYPLTIGATQMQRVANEMFLAHVMLPGSSTTGPYQIANMVQSEPALTTSGS